MPTRLGCVLFVLAACGGGDPPGGTPDAPVSDLDAPVSPPDAPGVTARPTGTVSGVTYTDNCVIPVGGQAPIGSTVPGFRCAQLTVSCPGLDDTTVQVALALADTTAASKGAIVTHAGGNGTGFLGNEVARGVYGRGWDLAQIAWDAPWECPLHEGRMCGVDLTPAATRAGIKDAACRPATVMKWIREGAQRRDGSPFVAAAAPMCGEGSSGGSGALWYALAHYGGTAWLDFVQVSASTPFARIDIGCDPTYAATTVEAACDNVAPPQVPVNYNSNGAGADVALNLWFSTDACDATPTADDLAMFARNSIVSEGADLAFATPVSAYVCVDAATVNVVPGMGHYMQSALAQADRFKALCVVSGTNGDCQGESVFADDAMAAAAVDELDAACVPLAR